MKQDTHKLDFLWETIDRHIEYWLYEDAGRGDITTDNLPLYGKFITAKVIAKSDGVACGVNGFLRIMEKVTPGVEVIDCISDGSEFKKGDVIIQFTGDARLILIAERTALNLLTHLSGIATLTRRYVKAIEGTGAKVVDTRKTIPGLRSLQKYAVRCGGGSNHRIDLSGAVMLKDNHLKLVGSDLEEMTGELKRKLGHTVKIEVEAESIETVERALSAGADIIMLDNMSLEDGRRAVKLVAGKAVTEASGGINLSNVREWAESGVDIISIGALTHSAPVSDMSLEINSV